MKIINFEKKKIIPLTNESQKSHEKTNFCQTCKKCLSNKHINDKNYFKVTDHCHYTGKHRGIAHSTCNLKCSIPKEVYVVFHDGSNYRQQKSLNESLMSRRKY